MIARTESGQLFVWGMNKQGQLGLGDDITRHQPLLLGHSAMKQAVRDYQEQHPGAASSIILSQEPGQYCIARIYADSHSSAAIDQVGRLYTWGSGANYRTMHPHTRVIKTPALVHRLARNEISHFAFSDKASAALVFSKLISVRSSVHLCIYMFIHPNHSFTLPLSL